MDDGVGAHLPGYFDRALGDQGPAQGRSQRVDPLVEGARLEARPQVAGHELVLQVVDENARGSRRDGFFSKPSQLLRLAEVRCQGDDLRAMIDLEPLEHDGGVETSRICEYIPRHCLIPFQRA